MNLKKNIQKATGWMMVNLLCMRKAAKQRLADSLHSGANVSAPAAFIALPGYEALPQSQGPVIVLCRQVTIDAQPKPREKNNIKSVAGCSINTKTIDRNFSDNRGNAALQISWRVTT